MQDEIKKKLHSRIDQSTTYKDTYVEPPAKERLQRFNADPEFYAKKFERLNESSVVDVSVSNAVSRIKAALMKIFFGSDEVGTIKGRTGDDDNNADNMQELVNWQIEYKNQGYLKWGNWFEEALYQLYSVIKITWQRETGQVEKTQQVPLMAMKEVAAQAEANGVEIAEAEINQTDPSIMDVTFSYEDVTENYPLIENVPASELIWSPNARTLQEADFVAQRKKVTIDHLRRNIKRKGMDDSELGMYDKKAVEEVAKGGEEGTDSDYDTAIKDTQDSQNDVIDKDDPEREVEIFECYFKHDINNDGLSEDVIATICGSVLLRCEENEDGLPFCIISPVYDPHRIVPKRGSMDNAGQYQDLLTAIIRLTIQNITYNNNPQQAYDPSGLEDEDDVIGGLQFIRLIPGGKADEVIQNIAQIPLAPYTLDLIQTIKGWVEETTSVNRYNQGIDSNSLNKTATGITALINQGSQMIELIARNYAETGVKDAIMRIVMLNQKYVDKEQVIRLTNKDIAVNKDNLAGDFDYVVNSGMGAGDKQSDIQNMNQLLAMMPNAIQGGVATTDNAYNAFRKLISSMGIKNTDDYCTDPKVIAQQKAQQPKQPEQPNISESIQAKLTDAPIEIQTQYWQKLGFQVDLGMFERQQQVEVQKENAKTDNQQLAAGLKEIAVSHLKKEPDKFGQQGAGTPGTTGRGMPNLSSGNLQGNSAGNMAGSKQVGGVGGQSTQQANRPLMY